MIEQTAQEQRYRPVKREGKALAWQVERWDGKRWRSVPYTCCYREGGAIQEANRRNERDRRGT